MTLRLEHTVPLLLAPPTPTTSHIPTLPEHLCDLTRVLAPGNPTEKPPGSAPGRSGRRGVPAVLQKVMRAGPVRDGLFGEVDMFGDESLVGVLGCIDQFQQDADVG